ncbi:MAG TPA: glycosyltransferase family 4 protein [Polyangia bacterium]|jgi:glycosyltransferase involved in cell wall biosynthesis|nr:glycosyltransferase family 4 protein [Polyangia bacterium]
MRILYHHRTQGEEPESIHIRAIVNALRGLGHEVEIVGPTPARGAAARAGRRSLLGRIKQRAPRWIFELMQLGYNVVVFARLWRAVNRFRPDFIYERYALFNAAGVALARWRGVPLILEVNTPYAQAWAQYFGLYLKRLARLIERRTLAGADHVITVTNVQKRMLAEEGIAAARITACHNAIAPEAFAPSPSAAEALRRTLGLRDVVVGFVGTMNRWQGIDRFPAVVETVLAARDDVSFLFVGEGEFRAALEDFCRSRGLSDRVVFTGRKPHDEIANLVAAMTITVLLNSNVYGSPMKVFEYLAMGKAVIAPRVEPVLEVLRDGETGLLIAPGDADAMARDVLRLAADVELRERLGVAGRAYVLANHTWDRNAATIIDVYERLAASSATGASSPVTT